MAWVCRSCRTKYASADAQKPQSLPRWADGHECELYSEEVDRTLTILNTIENCTVTDLPEVIEAIRKDIIESDK